MSDVYSMTRSEAKAGISVFVTDDVGGGGSIDRAMAMLAGIPHGADKAIGSAIKRAAQSGEAHAAKVIRQEYYIKAGDFKSYTQSKRKITSHAGETTVDIEFRGRHIPLMKFNTKFGSDGRVSVHVKRTSSGGILNHVFQANVGTHGHSGIFERVTDKRFPIEEKLGPSTPQMMNANDDIAQEIGDKVREVFDERLDHEILAVLNGWRQK